MEFVVFLLMIVFFFVAGNKDKGKKQRSAPPRRNAPRNVRTLRQQFHALEDQGEVVSQGVSADDDEGCVGGSMPHEHTEGETHAEHRRHVQALRRREAEEQLEAQMELNRAAMNVQKLRQAVVMSEILDKPVSLRRGRRGL